MKAEDRIAKKIVDGYGWLKLSDEKRLKYILRYINSVSNVNSTTMKRLFASYLAGRINHFYNSKNYSVDNKSVPFLKALKIVIGNINVESEVYKKL